MSDILFDKKTTCSFTGHRILKKDFNRDYLIEKIKETIESGYRTFLVGMAIGFDIVCFEELLKFKKKYNIDIIACVPCLNQSEKLNKEQQEEYDYCLKKADKVICLADKYFNGCMQQRNRFMIDNCSKLIAYMYSCLGGTVYTVNYAKSKNIRIEYID